MSDIVKHTENTPARYSAAETSVLKALENSPKILSMSISAIESDCLPFLIKAYNDAGIAIKGNESDQKSGAMVMLAQSVADDLFTYFKTLSIKEAGLAIQNGIRGEYGEYFGINVKSIHQFCKAYKDSSDRNEAIRKSKMKDEPEVKPTENEIGRIMKDACIAAFDYYKLNNSLTDYGGAKFTYLKKAGHIALTPDRYNSILERAKQQVIADAHVSIIKSGSDSMAGQIAKEVLKSADTHEITKNAARLIALREYFDFLIETETEMSELLND